MRFQNLTKLKPARVIRVPDGYFKENSTAPLPGDRVGIRHLSIGDFEYCYEEAKNFQEEGISNYHRSVMINVVARSLCEPDNVSKHYFSAGDLEARSTFTPEGIQYLYDIILQIHLTTSPIYEEISSENLDRLIALLKAKVITPKLRRILSYVLDEICQS